MYLYEMHQHTAGCSACGVADPAGVVRQIRQAGFAGVVLTNHFYHGNTGIRRNQPWEDFVMPYVEAYEIARQEGERLDIDVLFGLEENIGDAKEVLLYGITPEFVLSHPELRDGGLANIAALVHEAGGLVYQAHPYRVRDYIPRPWEDIPAQFLDGVEVYNACNSPVEDARALLLAQREGLLRCAGSDAHTECFEGRFGIACAHRIRTEAELAQVLRDGDHELYTGTARP